MAEKPKIAIIAPSFLPIPAIRGGAIETLITHFIDENEVEKQYDITVYQQNKYSVSNEIINKYKMSRFVFLSFEERLFHPIRLLLNHIRNCELNKGVIIDDYIFKVAGQIKKLKPQCILLEGCQIYAAYLRKIFPTTRLVLHVHTDILNIEAFHAREIVDCCDQIIAVSEYIKSQICRINNNFSHKVLVIKNCIDTHSFKPNDRIRKSMRKKLGYDNDDIVCIYSGRLSKDKGVLHLAKAFANVKEKHIKLLVLGAEWFSDETVSIVQQEMQEILEVVSDRVRFAGYIDHDVISQWYNAGDIAVVPSICNEAAGLVLIEAMSSGLAVIASRVGGIPEYVTKNSILLNKDEALVSSLTNNILRLANSSELRLSLAAEGEQHANAFNTKEYYKQMAQIGRNSG